MNSIRMVLGKNYWRRGIQSTFFLFYCWVGIRFYQYVLWALGKSPLFVERPIAVEAFLPLGAFVSFKRLVLTGNYDLIHPAALSIFLLALVLALLLRKSFCGYLCPIGAGFTLVEKIGEKWGITRRPPRWLSYLLYVPKYLLLAGFVYIFAQMGVRDIEAFMSTQYWRVSDTRMLLFFLEPTVITLVVTGVVLLGNLLIKGFWCQGLCPYGALLGLISLLSPVAVSRDAKGCISCGKCSRACPARIRVEAKNRVSSPGCMGCGECVSVCPVDNCLSFSVGYGRVKRRIPACGIPLATLLLLFMMWVWSVQAGAWYTPVDKQQIRKDHEVVRLLSHY